MYSLSKIGKIDCKIIIDGSWCGNINVNDKINQIKCESLMTVM